MVTIWTHMKQKKNVQLLKPTIRVGRNMLHFMVTETHDLNPKDLWWQSGSDWNTL